MLRRPDFAHVYFLVRASEAAELRKAMPAGKRAPGKQPRYASGPPRTLKALNWELVTRVNNNGVKCQLLKLVRQEDGRSRAHTDASASASSGGGGVASQLSD